MLVYVDSYNGPDKYGQFIYNFLGLLVRLKLKQVPALIIKDFIVKGGAKLALTKTESVVFDLAGAQVIFPLLLLH